MRGLLVSQISDGRLQPGQRLPSEPVLARQYGISRPTLREILSGLEADGLVRRVHGVGTFVAQQRPRVETSLDLDIGVTEAVLAAKKHLGIEVLRARRESAGAWIAGVLGLDPDDQVFAVERVIRVDDVPAAHALDVIPWDLLVRRGSPEYDGGSIYRFLERDCGIHLVGGVVEVTAALANTKMSAALGCRRNTPILRLDQTERSADGHPVLVSREHYVPGVFNLTVRRVRRGRSGLFSDEDGTAAE
ncbi:transcriptional regulator [Acrocarpospora phusangensis]|uniref:Transcriptional regulator n=1 Tax=Acrocarpospora phusangensis TaxID=1070424 RepID=A0A919QAN1_9ACTN|nr:GntR family transcriptional regulator [Acrocarpospora phusangensis]GIH24234.1 transcriptional regulator [Acrocarpospora phusangensis]